MRPFIVCLTLWALATGPVLSQNHFRPPDMTKEIFDTSKLGLDQFDRAGFVGALTALATEFEGDDDVPLNLRSQALAIAGRIDPKSGRVDWILEDIQARGRAFNNAELTKSRIQERLVLAATSLTKKGTEGPKVASYFADLSYRLDPESEPGKAAQTLLSDLQEKEIKADWSGLLGAPVTIESSRLNAFFDPQSRFKIRRASLPGGTADKFAARQRTINALVVFSLPNGSQIGAASELTTTASSVPESSSVEFVVNQEVGPDIQYSLEEAISLMDLRHGLKGRPKGRRVEIVFESKSSGQKVDGDSAGTAMALALEGLFTGFEIDPKYASTGTITSSGKVGRIGGVIAKMRGAVNRDCTVMSIPHGNRKDISDIYLLDGLKAITAIQVFAIKEFEEALALATTERSKELQDTLKLYDEVIKVVEEQGEVILKHTNTQERLNKILEVYPSHCTARFLLDLSKGNAPKTLSISGSMEEISKTFDPFADEIKEASRPTDGRIDGKKLMDASKNGIKALNELSDTIDPNTKPLLDAAIKMAKVFETIDESVDFRTQMRAFLQAGGDYQKEAINIVRNTELFEEEKDE